MTSRSALLIHLEPEYRDALTQALSDQGYLVTQVRLPEQECPDDTTYDCISLDSRQVLDRVRDETRDVHCMITSSCLPMQLPPAQNINYPPYDLYEYLLSRMRQQDYGRVVNLFYGPGSRKGLSLHQLQTIENRYDHLFDKRNILFNSVNIGAVETSSPEESERIFRERLETILWLATTDKDFPHKQFFRGYETA
jgi:hypothetical protein